ncbi:MAG: hypothetical protein N2746_01960 [Deltaproteobacteria bacterium]|nr:hypothetical protein [Deltaproteobacteria bacterium]
MKRETLLIIVLIVYVSTLFAQDKIQSTNIPKKPDKRMLFARVADYLVLMKVSPGVPEPQEVVELSFEIYREMKIADPVYGNLSPVMDVKLSAGVYYEKLPEAVYRYIVQPLQDAGSFGFHFFPQQVGKYIVKLDIIPPEQDIVTANFGIFVGVWPLPPGEEIDQIPRDESGKPIMIKSVGPVGPSGTAISEVGRGSESDIKRVMRELGRTWQYIVKDIFIPNKRLDLNGISRESKRMAEFLKKEQITITKDRDAQFSQFISDLIVGFESISGAADSKDEKAVIEAIQKVNYNVILRGHLRYRFKNVDADKYKSK